MAARMGPNEAAESDGEGLETEGGYRDMHTQQVVGLFCCIESAPYSFCLQNFSEGCTKDR